MLGRRLRFHLKFIMIALTQPYSINQSSSYIERLLKSEAHPKRLIEMEINKTE